MGRLPWWITWKKRSDMFKYIAKPLLSLRSTGSMSVERVAKPLKNSVWTMSRRRLGGQRAEMILRAGLNLNFLAAAKMDMKSKQ